uniref:Uncharacterized protein n=1 Tax=Cucumis melo TaxID=3656 RepID=A0A9I9DSI9_CUCME
MGKGIGEQCSCGVKATAEFERGGSKKAWPLLFSILLHPNERLFGQTWPLERGLFRGPHRPHGPVQLLRG